VDAATTIRGYAEDSSFLGMTTKGGTWGGGACDNNRKEGEYRGVGGDGVVAP